MAKCIPVPELLPALNGKVSCVPRRQPDHQTELKKLIIPLHHTVSLELQPAIQELDQRCLQDCQSAFQAYVLRRQMLTES